MNFMNLELSTACIGLDAGIHGFVYVSYVLKLFLIRFDPVNTCTIGVKLIKYRTLCVMYHNVNVIITDLYIVSVSFCDVGSHPS